MSNFVAAQTRLFVGGYEITADLTKIVANVKSEVLDNTTFGTTTPTSTRSRIGGLKTAQISADGYANLGSSQTEGILFNKVGLNNDLVTAFGNGVTAGSTAAGSGFGLQAVDDLFKIGDAVGKLLPVSFDAQSAGPLLRAVVLNDFSASALSTGTTNGTAYQLPTPTTCESLYAGVHVLGVSTALGGTVQVLVQNGSSSGFGVSATRVTFSAATCRQGQYATPVASANLSTDMPFWRVQVVVSTGSSTGAQATGLAWISLQS